MRSLSALIYLLGNLILLSGGVGSCIYLLVATSITYSVGVAACGVVLLIVGILKYWEYITIPWVLWRESWVNIDRRIG